MKTSQINVLLGMKKSKKAVKRGVTSIARVEVMRRTLCTATKCGFCGFFNQVAICKCIKCLNSHITCDCDRVCPMIGARMRSSIDFGDFLPDTEVAIDPITSLSDQGFLHTWLQDNKLQLTEHWRTYGLCSDEAFDTVLEELKPLPPQFCNGCLIVASAIDYQYPGRVSDIACRF